MTKFITYKGQRVDFNAAWADMDEALREKAWNMTSDAQSCFDNYTEMHEEKFGKPFEVQPSEGTSDESWAEICETMEIGAQEAHEPEEFPLEDR